MSGLIGTRELLFWLQEGKVDFKALAIILNACVGDVRVMCAKLDMDDLVKLIWDDRLFRFTHVEITDKGRGELIQ